MELEIGMGWRGVDRWWKVEGMMLSTDVVGVDEMRFALLCSAVLCMGA